MGFLEKRSCIRKVLFLHEMNAPWFGVGMAKTCCTGELKECWVLKSSYGPGGLKPLGGELKRLESCPTLFMVTSQFFGAMFGPLNSKHRSFSCVLFVAHQLGLAPQHALCADFRHG